MSGTKHWNVYYKSSTNGGVSWGTETVLSTVPASPPSYINANGFLFPYGDYFELAIDSLGDTQAVWGARPNYTGPGSCWYTSGN